MRGRKLICGLWGMVHMGGGRQGGQDGRVLGGGGPSCQVVVFHYCLCVSGVSYFWLGIQGLG